MQNEGYFYSNTFQEIDASGVGGAHVVPMDTTGLANTNYILQADGTVCVTKDGTYYVSYVSEVRHVGPLNEYTSFWELQKNGTGAIGGNGVLVCISPEPMANHTKNMVLELKRGDILAVCASKPHPSHLWSDVGALTLFIAEL